MAGFVSLHFPISVTFVETKEILTSESEAQLRKVHPPERVGDCGVPLGLLVRIAGSPGDGGLFFRSPVVVVYLPLCQCDAGSRLAKSMHLVEHRRWILWLYNAWSPLA